MQQTHRHPIPAGVTVIEDNAFGDCYSLTCVIILEGVTDIKGNAFGTCTDLKAIVLPTSVMEIAAQAFIDIKTTTWIYYNGTEDQMNAALKSLNQSQNKFIVNAVIAYMKSDTAKDEALLENIRQIFREEVQAVAVVSPPPAATSVSLELTEDEESENAKSVVVDLDMFD